MVELIYIDSNVVIDFIEKDDRNLAILFAEAEDGVHRLMTSELTLAGVLVQPLQRKDVLRIELFETLLADRKLIETYAINRKILRRSAELRATLGGKTPDSIHVATAIAADCSVIVSSDRRLKVPEPLQRLSSADLQGRSGASP
ncbi:MAG: type II toxin-antitoxin system VapC family toxin [Rhizobiaceae bacterium]|nr:type II toxin-antitoxin system VapC family toxin [Rhizobiaceae bacterium]